MSETGANEEAWEDLFSAYTNWQTSKWWKKLSKLLAQEIRGHMARAEKPQRITAIELFAESMYRNCIYRDSCKGPEADEVGVQCAWDICRVMRAREAEEAPKVESIIVCGGKIMAAGKEHESIDDAIAAIEKTRDAENPAPNGGPSMAGKPRSCPLFPGNLECQRSCDDSKLCAQTWAAAGSKEVSRELGRLSSIFRAKGDARGGLTGKGYHCAADSVDAVQASVEADHKIAEAARSKVRACYLHPQCDGCRKGCNIVALCAQVEAESYSKIYLDDPECRG